MVLLLPSISFTFSFFTLPLSLPLLLSFSRSGSPLLSFSLSPPLLPFPAFILPLYPLSHPLPPSLLSIASSSTQPQPSAGRDLQNLVKLTQIIAQSSPSATGFGFFFEREDRSHIPTQPAAIPLLFFSPRPQPPILQAALEESKQQRSSPVSHTHSNINLWIPHFESIPSAESVTFFFFFFPRHPSTQHTLYSLLGTGS